MIDCKKEPLFFLILHKVLFPTKKYIFWGSCAKSRINSYSHLSNSRGGWNKRRGDAKVAKSINVEVGLNVEGGSLTFVHIHLEYSIVL